MRRQFLKTSLIKSPTQCQPPAQTDTHCPSACFQEQEDLTIKASQHLHQPLLTETALCLALCKGASDTKTKQQCLVTCKPPAFCEDTLATAGKSGISREQLIPMLPGMLTHLLPHLAHQPGRGGKPFIAWEGAPKRCHEPR